MNSLISIKSVTKVFTKGKTTITPLENLSLEVARGEFLSLMGPSGSGKTTLLTLIGALRSAQKGCVRVLDQELNNASEKALIKVRRQIGYIFQTHNLLDSLTIHQNVQMALQPRTM